MKYLLITVVVGAHVAVIGGSLLIQGCGTTRGPVALPTEMPMPPSVAQEDIVRPVPVAEPYRPPVPPPAVAPVPAPGHTAAAVPQETTTYAVGKGDTLSGIAQRYGVTVADIMVLNNIRDGNVIRIGQQLKLPGSIDVSAPKPASKPKPEVLPAMAGAGSRYVVQPGDSLSVIAYRSGITLKALRDANGITGERILVGQELIIPGGRPVAPRVQAPPEPVPEVRPAPVLAPELQMRALPPDLPSPTPLPRNTYTVQPGDDILTVASHHNVSIAELRRVNNLTSDTLLPGRTLIIPAAE